MDDRPGRRQIRTLRTPLRYRVTSAAITAAGGGDTCLMNWTALHAALRELLWEWDPIGVADCAPQDEYDCLIGPLLDRLKAGAGGPAIGHFLRQELTSHFGLDLADNEIDSVAERVVAWWAGSASAVIDPGRADTVPGM